MGDLHQVIIHYIGKMIGGHAVRLEQDLVVQVGGLHADLPPYDVLHLYFCFFSKLKPDNVGAPLIAQLFHLLFRKCKRIPHLLAGSCIICKSLSLLIMLLPGLIKLVGRVKSIIGIP